MRQLPNLPPTARSLNLLSLCMWVPLSLLCVVSGRLGSWCVCG